jgi:hypothetical protein
VHAKEAITLDQMAQFAPTRVNRLHAPTQQGHSLECSLYQGGIEEMATRLPSSALSVAWLARHLSRTHVVEGHTGCAQGKGICTVLLHEIFAIQGNPRKMGSREAKSNVRDHRILNGGIT